ncbi:hypothetical protein PsorP6_000122 [Peronosclerospora sorghi]|uniref:Uncharacterized protein n=1 Tax=Peronosclerospora sorghi TaxID=230839 RepID=A0ACC0WZ06_9STRA|nr:hypothetical protein PsorP6_000122 [Peronosclerospora sorghi]
MRAQKANAGRPVIVFQRISILLRDGTFNTGNMEMLLCANLSSSSWVNPWIPDESSTRAFSETSSWRRFRR